MAVPAGLSSAASTTWATTAVSSYIALQITSNVGNVIPEHAKHTVSWSDRQA